MQVLSTLVSPFAHLMPTVGARVAALARVEGESVLPLGASARGHPGKRAQSAVPFIPAWSAQGLSTAGSVCCGRALFYSNST